MTTMHPAPRSLAQAVKSTYDKVLKELTVRARGGCNKSASLVLQKMTEFNNVLAHLGYATTDSGRLVFHKNRQVDPRTALALRAAKGDATAARQLLALAGGLEGV